MNSTLFLHRAPWVVPITSPPVADGAVAVAGNRIVGIGTFAALRRQWVSAACIDHPDTIVLPGLVNAHIHLELSHLAQLSSDKAPVSFTGWITALLAAREKDGAEEDYIRSMALQALAAQASDGVVVAADIGNTSLGATLDKASPCRVIHFLEYLGLSEQRSSSALARLALEDDKTACTAHAPYSTHASLIQALKMRANGLGHCFPLHVAESPAETEMVRWGTGEIPDFLRERGIWDNSFHPTGIDKTGSVRYLHQLGVLDHRTLCVHGVEVSEEEMDLLSKSGSHVCCCPGSNRYLGVGKAPVPGYLRHGILPALGTDSLASNPQISLWREMQVLAEDHPDVLPADILAMATLAGARALGLAGERGSLDKGKQAGMIGVFCPECARLGNKQVLEFLVTAGSGRRVTWLDNDGDALWPA